MKTRILTLLGVAALATPLAPRGCASLNIGISYDGQYGTYTATRRSAPGEPASYDVRMTVDGKRVIEPD